MGVFERILLNYGSYTLIRVRDIFERYELYERCAEINKVLGKHNVSTSMSLEDWQSEFWRKGMSGNVACANTQNYFSEAIMMCIKQGKFDGVEVRWSNVKLCLTR